MATLSLPGRLGRISRPGGLEVGLVVLVGALAAGAVLGTGLSRTVLSTPDPLTWLRNDKGQVTRVNPETGRMTDRLQVGNPGDPLSVVQGNGVLVVTNLRTHEVTVIDLSMLRAGPSHGSAGDVKVLLSGRQIFVVDKASGRVLALDPVTGVALGSAFDTGGPIVDAAVDGNATVFTLGADRRLVSLRFVDQRFVEQSQREVAGADAQTVLVAHDSGVTVVDPAGSATRISPGEPDTTVQAPGLPGPLLVPDVSPADLVPVASSGADRLYLVRDNDVVTVDGSAFGCRDLGTPQVYRGLVYFPCPSDAKVVLIDRNGRRAGDDLRAAPSGAPELVLNAGLLFINVPGAETGLVVRPDGSTQRIQTDDPSIPVEDPAAHALVLPSGMGNLTSPSLPTPGRSGPQSPSVTPTGRSPDATAGRSATPSAGPRSGSTGGSHPPTILPPITDTPPQTGPPPTGATDRPTTAAPTNVPTTDQPTTGGSTGPSPTAGQPGAQDFTPTAATATANADNSVTITWSPPPNTPDGYRIQRADTGEQMTTALGGANSAIVTGAPLGTPIRFVVVADFPTGSYPSAPTNPVAAFGRPAAPTVAVQVLNRGPTKAQLRITVTVGSDGGSPVASFDVSVTDVDTNQSFGTTPAVPIAKNPYTMEVGADCAHFNGCFGEVIANVDVTLNNAAGAGPAGSTIASIPAPGAVTVGNAMFVTYGGECVSGSLVTVACDAVDGQVWQLTASGSQVQIRNFAGTQCLTETGGLHLAGDCTSAATFWSRLSVSPPQGPVAGGMSEFKNGADGSCLSVNGDPGAAGISEGVAACTSNVKQLSFALFQPLILATAARLPSTSDGPQRTAGRPGQAAGGRGLDDPVGLDTTALLLLPLAVVAGRRSRRLAGRRLVKRRLGRWRPADRPTGRAGRR